MTADRSPNSEALDPQSLMAAAVSTTGLSDFGDCSVVESLTVYLDAVRNESRLSPLGTMMMQESMNRALVNRLRFEEDWNREPAIRNEVVVAPVVIVGLPRTGTSKLQRLMSADPGVQALRLWRMLNPAPFPEADTLATDPRIDSAHVYEQLLGQVCPDLMAAVEWQAEEPEEEFFLMELTFQSMAQITRSSVPSYAEWLDRQPRQPVYDYLHRLLRYLQWQDGGGRGRPWILKSPTHLGALQALADTFPGLTLVQTHRDLTSAVPSLARLLEVARRLMTEDVDPHAIGDEVLELFSREMTRAIAARDRLSGVTIVDVSYGEIVHDPLRVVESVFDVHGRPLSSEARQRMIVWQDSNPQHRFGRHVYSMERYGLTAERIATAFAPYLDRFGAILDPANAAA